MLGKGEGSGQAATKAHARVARMSADIVWIPNYRGGLTQETLDKW